MLVDDWAKQILEAVQDFMSTNDCEATATIFVATDLYQQAMSEILGQVSVVAFVFANELYAPTIMGYPIIKTLPDNRCQFKIVVEKA